ncbi:hypothetical protein HED55_00295 [Ochrobactrum haematophilum]|uniref:Uncharacterized protein n=1 Tax=Brucella haematophila TaxID=419474 RepID=A0ABX1DHH4_9HYPH|nr:hypothetical protein [Brucella haematophila]
MGFGIFEESNHAPLNAANDAEYIAVRRLRSTSGNQCVECSGATITGPETTRTDTPHGSSNFYNARSGLDACKQIIRDWTRDRQRDALGGVVGGADI